MSSLSTDSGPQSRVRSGCNTCRSRHLKCDETRPVCCRCVQSRRVCDYSLHLIWEEDALSLGKCHGRVGTWSKNARVRNETKSLVRRPRAGSEAELEPILPAGNTQGSLRRQRSHQAFLNTTTEHLILYYKLAELKCMPREDKRLYQTHLSRAALDQQWCERNLLSVLNSGGVDFDISLLSSSLASSEVERILVDYYKNVVCLDSVHIYHDDEYDARQFIFSWALRSRNIFIGMLMLSANLLKSRDSRFVAVAVGYRHRVLQLLRALLSTEGPRSEVIMLACLLCTVEIRDQCSPTWVTHLAVYRDMIQQRLDGDRSSYPEDYIYRLGCRYFACHLVMAKTTFSVEDIVPSKISSSTLITTHAESQQALLTNKAAGIDSSYQPWTSTENLLSVMCPDTLSNIDTYSGLSNSLLMLINEITDLKREILSTSRMPISVKRIGETRLLTKAEQINDSLLNLQQFVPSSISSSDPVFGVHLQQTAEAYRLAGLILLHETLSVSSSFSTAVRSGRNDPQTYIPFESAVVDHDVKTLYIRSVLTLVGNVLTQNTPNCSWPLWPLFVASCCAKTETDKIVALNLFETAQQKINLGNIVPAFKVVQGVWQQQELQADEQVCPRTRKRRLQQNGRQRTAQNEEQRFDGCYDWEKVMAAMGYQISLA